MPKERKRVVIHEEQITLLDNIEKVFLEENFDMPSCCEDFNKIETNDLSYSEIARMVIDRYPKLVKKTNLIRNEVAIAKVKYDTIKLELEKTKKRLHLIKMTIWFVVFAWIATVVLFSL